MAPSAITEDYYMILEVAQTATIEQVVRSYRRLALNLHPDRNAKSNVTQAFQQLGRAYETLKDESKRRAYDLIYPSIKQNGSSRPTTEEPRPPPTSTPKSEPLSEAAQIAALQKSKQERTAEAAEEAWKNGWTSWLLSPIQKKPVDSDEEKARKDRMRQERKLEKDMKERRLDWKETDLSKEESLLRNAQAEVDTADLADDRKIQVIQDRIRARETKEREMRERVEREKRERERKKQREQQEQREKVEREKRERERKKQREQQEQREKREREAREVMLKKLAEERAAEQKREVERARMRQKIIDDNAEIARQRRANCRHAGWWPKVEGRTSCPECSESWSYLLQCPGCEMQACPKCQYDIRHSHRKKRNGTRTNRSQNYSYDNDDDGDYGDYEYTSYY
ncbi:hypothetical protein CJF32_00005384 [Rutstroemia sp. NJR-2017a WRK4]|nr:hypothetical protein CJF32_00005384 [Rutstroemia sp. NJR-2017a WRK4]